MRSLYCYYSEKEIRKDNIKILSEFLSSFPNILPVYAIIGDNIGVNILMPANGGITKIKWKKFRNPTTNKYVNATLYKFGKLGKLKEDVKFKVIEVEGLKEVRIEYDNYRIYFPNKNLTDHEREKIISLAKGELVVSPFEPIAKEQILIL